MSRHSYQKVGSDVAFWESYEKSPVGEKHVHATGIQKKLDDIRELKDAIKFSSMAGDLTSYESAMEAWCESHSAKLETMGVKDVFTAIQRKAPSIQVIVLAYYLLAVGPSVCYGWTDVDKKRMSLIFPMLDVCKKMVNLGVEGEFARNVAIAAICVPCAYMHNVPVSGQTAPCHHYASVCGIYTKAISGVPQLKAG